MLQYRLSADRNMTIDKTFGAPVMFICDADKFGPANKGKDHNIKAWNQGVLRINLIEFFQGRNLIHINLLRVLHVGEHGRFLFQNAVYRDIGQVLMRG